MQQLLKPLKGVIHHSNVVMQWLNELINHQDRDSGLKQSAFRTYVFQMFTVKLAFKKMGGKKHKKIIYHSDEKDPTAATVTPGTIITSCKNVRHHCLFLLPSNPSIELVHHVKMKLLLWSTFTWYQFTKTNYFHCKWFCYLLADADLIYKENTSGNREIIK